MSPADDCLIKAGHYLLNVKDRFEPTTEVTAESCASACSENEDCTVFSHIQAGTTQSCAMIRTGKLREKRHQNSMQTFTSGICPKSDKTLREEGIADIPSTAPNLQCIKEDPTQLCHFPFLYQGELQWDSIRDESGQCKCLSVAESYAKVTICLILI